MIGEKVLFISGSIGLGHVTRDMAIANALRKKNPRVEISWIASEPACNVLIDAGEKTNPSSKDWANENVVAESVAEGNKLNIVTMLSSIRDAWKHNVGVLMNVTAKENFDLVIGDETYEIIVAFKKKPELKTLPFVMIYDFIGSYAMTKNPKDVFGSYYWNYFWSKDYHKESPFVDLRLFIGELEDIPDTKFGFLLPRRRAWAQEKCTFTGYVLRFDPKPYVNQKETRIELGYGKSPVIVCSIGGTSIGKEMLELCGRSFPIIKEKIPNVRMVLVCGPRLAPETLRVPEGCHIEGYVPNLYEHFAACDLAIVQAGATTTIELTALRKPFLYFPLEDHYEQRIHVRHRLARHNAGVFMDYSKTTPQSLADAIVQNLGKQPEYAEIQTDGAQKAAESISKLL